MSEERKDHLKQAAAPTYQRIDRDLEQASRHAAGAQRKTRTRRILRLIRDNLFDPGLNVERVRRTLGLKSNDATTRFRREVGEAIKRYIVLRRLEVACRLLIRTELSTHEIARMVGWKAFKSFSHTFNKRLGCRPRAYRASGGRLSKRPLEPPRQGPATPEAGLPQRGTDGEPPRFVAAVATVAEGARCRRCRARVQPGPAARVFEDRQAICGPCALEHAPRELVDFLFVNAPHRRLAAPEKVERLADPERALRGLQGQLSRAAAEALIWALACRYPRSAGIVRGILSFQEEERDRRLDKLARRGIPGSS